MHDIIIIGAGPAGISAALYARRANTQVLVLHHGQSALGRTERIENYYGFAGGIGGAELYRAGTEQARQLGVELAEQEALGIQFSDSGATYLVRTSVAEYECKSVIIATGSKKLRPNIPRIAEFEGRGVSYCAVCDGFFYRGKSVAVIGSGTYALSEASELSHITGAVKILSNGLDTAELDAANERGIPVVRARISAVRGEQKVTAVAFEDGTELAVDGLFVALGAAGAGDFAKKLGVLAEGDRIVVNGNMETNVPGIYSCGDCAGGLLQVAKAVYEGAQAGLKAAQYARTH